MQRNKRYGNVHSTENTPSVDINLEDYLVELGTVYMSTLNTKAYSDIYFNPLNSVDELDTYYEEATNLIGNVDLSSIGNNEFASLLMRFLHAGNPGLYLSAVFNKSNATLWEEFPSIRFAGYRIAKDKTILSRPAAYADHTAFRAEGNSLCIDGGISAFQARSGVHIGRNLGLGLEATGGMYILRERSEIAETVAGRADNVIVYCATRVRNLSHKITNSLVINKSHSNKLIAPPQYRYARKSKQIRYDTLDDGSRIYGMGQETDAMADPVREITTRLTRALSQLEHALPRDYLQLKESVLTTDWNALQHEFTQIKQDYQEALT